MKLLAAAFLVAMAPVISAGQDFAGRWDITVSDQGQTRAWWLELGPAGSGKGSFVGAPDGSLDPVHDLTVKDAELRFTVQWERNPPLNGVFTARLVDGKLQGDFTLEGKPKLTWTGKRSPVIADKDDGTWREGKPIQLFNGKDLSGWEPEHPPEVYMPPVPTDPAAWGWSAEDGLLATKGRGTSLGTKAKFWNFALHLEFRVGPRGNSGVCLRGRYEVQIANDAGRAGAGHGTGSVISHVPAAVNASKPAGEWQTYDIRLVGREVTVILNGTKLSDKAEIAGLTAVALDANEDQPGPLVLQGDHGAVDFRNIVLTPLIK
jgi:hypothetical protein